MPSFQQPLDPSQLDRIESKLDAIIAALAIPVDLPPAPQPSTMDQDLRSIRMQEGPIQAIKRCREMTGWGLKEAKLYVEAL
ncbi:hypothetical protein [Acidipropionibacterium virtanenii]|uniref:Ribosomal protein L7/L12 C-terminal domain-containing protein n=1 Tax=Acidipropionibacterium virtanenii TaxID=2057246 RepID=A0A344UV15_9ACTN|nr:hypothetical protein [Acidipropionibacterium virtanenii]AXE39113.1 hypothetical protein JS278_01957 [Acidipropionibacterium virtanenii]